MSPYPATHFFMARGGQITGTLTFLCGYSAKVAPGLRGYYIERLSECAARGDSLIQPVTD